MSRLRKRFTEDLQLAGKGPRTVESYVRSVRQLSEHFGKSPDLLTLEDIREYFLHVKNVKKWRRRTMTIAICGIKMFWELTLKRKWNLTGIVRPQKETVLPVILSFKEVKRIISNVHSLRMKACIQLIYSCGLRLSESVNVRVCDVDGERDTVFVHFGKGAKDRYVPLPGQTRVVLRAYYASHMNDQWLFPCPGKGMPKGGLSVATKPMSIAGVQKAFQKAKLAAGIRKQASVHTLRHSYATHLLEQGVDLQSIQEWMGHNTPTTTAKYAHLTQKVKQLAVARLNKLIDRL